MQLQEKAYYIILHLTSIITGCSYIVFTYIYYVVLCILNIDTRSLAIPSVCFFLNNTSAGDYNSSCEICFGIGYIQLNYAIIFTCTFII